MGRPLGTSIVTALCLVAVVTASACKKPDEAAAKAPAAAPTPPLPPGPDGVRRIAIKASEDGYQPDRIEGKAGEKLDLVFTRTVDGDCLAQVKVGTGALVALPMDTPVEVAVTVPASGELAFACGMDMVHGVIVAD